jgi:hypothetical protein
MNPDAEPQSNPHAPVFLTFGTNVTSLTAGQSVVFSAVLTDPDGIADLIGGALKSGDSAITYGSFATADQEGAYSLSLTWDQLQTAEDITFKQSQARMFMAEFFDAEGHSVEKTIAITLTCTGGYACEGMCETSSCSEQSTSRTTCDAVCSGAHPGMTCDPANTAGRYASYGAYTAAIPTCSTTPPATFLDATFMSMGCGCNPAP